MAVVLISAAMTQCKEEDPNVPVTGVKLDKTTLTLATGSSDKLTATVEPEKATEKTVTWTSSDASIATVGEDGTVTTVKAGSATITVTTKDGAKKATCEVTVSDLVIAVTGVTLDETTLTLTVGDKHTLTATVEPDNATEKNVLWNTSDGSKVTVSASGELEALAAGTATITVSTVDGNKTATCTVIVNDPPVGNERTLKAATISVFAGGNEAGFEDGAGTAARFNNPIGICLDGDGNLYVGDYYNHAVRKITPTGTVTTLLGNTDPAWEIAAHGPYDVAISGEWLYIVERLGSRIRRAKLGSDMSWPENVNVFAGNDNIYNSNAAVWEHANGQGNAARFSGPSSITADNAGNLYVSDFYNRAIRKITPNGTVSDYVGPLCVACNMGSGDDSDMLSYPREICYNPADGNLYVAAANRERIVKITGKDTYDTFVGWLNEKGEAEERWEDNYNNGPAGEVHFARPGIIAIDQSGYMFIGEQGGPCGRIRFITPSGHTSTLADGDGTPCVAHGALLPRFVYSSTGIAVTPDGKTLYVVEGGNHKIWKIELQYDNY
jgi:sugar lactone lactonase YvrE